jgi:pyridoxal phosphate-dependent aminotransferase EpsN
MDSLKEICNQYGVPIIEDAAESLGATYKGRASGTLTDFGVFSFNGNKIITTSGGGMLVSNSQKALNRARFLAGQAREPTAHYLHKELGYNYQMSNLLAGVGRGQLQVLNDRVNSRRKIFMRYFQALKEIKGVDFMPEAEFGSSTRWLTALTLDPGEIRITPREIIAALEAENIEARPVWKPMHLQPLFKSRPYFPHKKGESFSDSIFKRGLCLPSGSNLSVQDQDRIISIIQRQLKHST